MSCYDGARLFLLLFLFLHPLMRFRDESFLVNAHSSRVQWVEEEENLELETLHTMRSQLCACGRHAPSPNWKFKSGNGGRPAPHPTSRAPLHLIGGASPAPSWWAYLFVMRWCVATLEGAQTFRIRCCKPQPSMDDLNFPTSLVDGWTDEGRRRREQLPPLVIIIMIFCLLAQVCSLPHSLRESLALEGLRLASVRAKANSLSGIALGGGNTFIFALVRSPKLEHARSLALCEKFVFLSLSHVAPWRKSGPVRHPVCTLSNCAASPQRKTQAEQ